MLCGLGMYPATVTVRGRGGVVGAVRSDDPRDHVTNIWITDQDGAELCHRTIRAEDLQPTLSCWIAVDNATTVQAHVLSQRTGLYSGPVVNPAHDSYANSAELVHQAFSSIPAKLENYEAGFGYLRVQYPSNALHTAGSDNIIGVLRHWLDRHNGQAGDGLITDVGAGISMSNQQLGRGIASAARRALALGCSFGSDTENPYYVNGGNCTSEEVVALATAFAVGSIDGRVNPSTVAVLGSAFTASLPLQAACSTWMLDMTAPCYTSTRETFVGALGDLRSSLHHLLLLASVLLEYIDVLVAELPVTMHEHDPYIQLDQTTGSLWCGVLGEGASTTTLTSDPVDSMWLKDQHGVIVHFVNLSGSTSPPSFTLDLITLGSEVTSLVPYQRSSRGIWKGLDPLEPSTPADTTVPQPTNPNDGGGGGGGGPTSTVISATATDGEEDDGDGNGIITICAIVTVVVLGVCCVFIFFVWGRRQHVWFLRSADGVPIYRATSSSSKLPPTQDWEVCKGKEKEDRENISSTQAEPAPQILLGGDTTTAENAGSSGDGGAKSKDDAKGKFVTVEGAGDPRFNGTDERTEKLAGAKDDDRKGRAKWVKQGGDGEYMVVGGKEEKPKNQKDAADCDKENSIYDGGVGKEEKPEKAMVAAICHKENPLYDGGAEGPEGGGDGYLDVESAT